MFERFTTAARTAVAEAQQQAGRRRAEVLGSEHLLLALAHAPVGDPARDTLIELGLTSDAIDATLDRAGTRDADAAALESLGIDLAHVRRRIEAEFGSGALDEPAPSGRRPRRRDRGGAIRFGDDAKAVLELALREAVRRHDSSIESGHLLLGLSRLGSGLVVRVFEERHVDLGLLRTLLEQRMRTSA